MGMVFLIEKEEPAFTCATCNVQIALRAHLLDDWLNLFQFSHKYVYNVMVGEDVVSYCNDLYDGYEVSCVNCCSVIGWRQIENESGTDEPEPDEPEPDEPKPDEPKLVYVYFEHGRITPPPDVQP